MFSKFAFGCGYAEEAQLSYILMEHLGGADEIKIAIRHFVQVLIYYLEEYEGWYKPPEECCLRAQKNKNTFCPDCGKEISSLPVENKPKLEEENEELAEYWKMLFRNSNNSFPYDLHLLLEENGWIFTNPGGTNWVLVEGLDNILLAGITDRSINVYTRCPTNN